MFKKSMLVFGVVLLMTSNLYAGGEPVKVNINSDLKKIKTLNVKITHSGFYNSSAIKQEKLKNHALSIIKKMLSNRGINITNKSSTTLYIENTISVKQQIANIDVRKSSTTYPLKYEPGKYLAPETTYYTDTQTIQYEDIKTISYAQIKKGNVEIAFAETRENTRSSWTSEEDIVKEEIRDLIEGLFGKIEGEDIN